MHWIARNISLAAVLIALCGHAIAHAQPEAAKAYAEKSADKPADDSTALAASLGGSLNTGNTKSWQLNAGGNFLLVRSPHALSAAADFAVGRADLRTDTEGYVDTVKNLRAKLRYDFFVSDLDAVFAAGAIRWDRFAGLDPRVQGQLGYLRYFFRETTHRFWGELGYDITYDNYYPIPPMTMLVTDSEVVHSARLFVGYDNHVNESVTYLTGLEALMNVESPKDTRINFDNALRSAISGKLQVEVKFSLQFDNVPAPGARKLDTQTLVSLIYNLI